MAFGKRSLTSALLDRFNWDYATKQMSRGEAMALRVPPADTPLGETALLAATEDTMVGPLRTCPKCHVEQRDVGLSLTGTCSTCWAKENKKR